MENEQADTLRVATQGRKRERETERGRAIEESKERMRERERERERNYRRSMTELPVVFSARPPVFTAQ